MGIYTAIIIANTIPPMENDEKAIITESGFTSCVVVSLMIHKKHKIIVAKDEPVSDKSL